MKKMTLARLVLVTSILGPWLAAAQTSPSKTNKVSTKPPAKGENGKQEDVGEQKFKANCSRCHSAPEQLSPSLTGTVVRHMRVRASLSAQDEKDILRYLAP
jgi:cytochrome c2